MVPSTFTDDGCRSAWHAIGIVLNFSRNPGPLSGFLLLKALSSPFQKHEKQ